MQEAHLSIKNITNFMLGKDLKFSFIFETKKTILAEIQNLDNKKALPRKRYAAEDNKR